MVLICIGTANWQQGYGIDISFDACKEVLTCAKHNNILYIDTAQSYSGVETILGNLGVSNFNVITKLPTNYKHKNFDNLLKIVRISLHKLNSETVYGLLAHTENIYNYDKFIKDMQKLKHEGFIKNVGVSIYNPDRALDYSVEADIDIIQVPFNIIDRRLLDNCFFRAAKDKQIFIRSVFLRGALVMSEHELAKNNLTWVESYLTKYYKFVLDYNMRADVFCLIGAINTIKKICDSAVFIIGVDNSEQLRHNIDMVVHSKLSDDIINQWWSELPELPEKVLNPSLWR